MQTLEPIQEHLDLYLKMRKLSEDLGMPLPSDGVYS
jgi:hypothetical protein